MMPSKRGSRKKRSLNPEALARALRSNAAHCAYAVAVGTVVMCILFVIAITPQRYDLKVGDIAPDTITASKDVVDEISTARQREEAAAQVEPIYIFKEDVADEVLQNLSSVLSQVTAVQQYGRNILESFAPDDPAAQNAYVFADAELDYARSLLTMLSLQNYQLSTLLHATDEQISDMCANLTAAVENTLNTTIREGYVNEAIQYLQQIMGYKTDMDLLQNVVTPILRKVIQPNMLIDQEAARRSPRVRGTGDLQTGAEHRPCARARHGQSTGNASQPRPVGQRRRGHHDVYRRTAAGVHQHVHAVAAFAHV